MRRGLRRLERHRVVIYTKDDRSLTGVLIAVHADSLQIAQPKYLREEGPEPLPGEVSVPSVNVSFLQRLPPEVP